MEKKIQVVMLPTNEKAQSFITLLHGKLYLNDKLHGYDTIQKPQHLYFLSDEEIKEGDWVYEGWIKHNGENPPHRIQKTSTRISKELTAFKKIIATTDRLVYWKALHEEDEGVLPQPSQSFLEVFVREYNKGNVIKEVMVEYESHNNCSCGMCEFIKINPKDNTITIKRVKDSWSREEVLNEIQKSFVLLHLAATYQTNKEVIEQNL